MEHEGHGDRQSPAGKSAQSTQGQDEEDLSLWEEGSTVQRDRGPNMTHRKAHTDTIKGRVRDPAEMLLIF